MSENKNSICLKTIGSHKAMLKLIVTGLLLLILYKIVDKQGLVEILKDIRLKTLGILILLYVSGQFISAYKWSRLLKATGLEYGYATICRAYFFGMFVNAAAFGTVGGDVARGVFLKPQAGQGAKVASSIVVDRIHGLMTLILVSVAGFFFAGQILISGGLLLSFVLALTVWYLAPTRIRSLCANYPLLAKIFNAFDLALPKTKSLLLEITALSAMLHLLQVSIYPIIFAELSNPLPLAVVFAFVPLVNIASSLPLSVQGLGVREGLLAMFFAHQGLTVEHAIAAGLLWFVTVSTVSLLAGAWILIVDPQGRSRNVFNDMSCVHSKPIG